mmetsp:Transcript_53839/g.161103  ORF Transcript_53839/g.161103 Transcript_53839/m.161103 type:complete len:85 (-) Transcript_53839:269-523(-)
MDYFQPSSRSMFHDHLPQEIRSNVNAPTSSTAVSPDQAVGTRELSPQQKGPPRANRHASKMFRHIDRSNSKPSVRINSCSCFKR